jgi:butyryl-CoA dehydrogenase
MVTFLIYREQPWGDVVIEFELTEEQRLLQLMIREFAEAELKPGAAEREKTGEFPHDAIMKLRRMGLFGLIFPKEYGGKERDIMDFAVAVEELAHYDASVAIILDAHTLCASHINAFGTVEQKERFLTPLASGEKLGAWALAEPDTGSDAGCITTTAVADGEGWCLSGNKTYVTNGSQADILVVLASTAKPRGAKDISAFIVPGDAPGLSRGELLDKRGFHSSDTVALVLEDIRVPRAALLGCENQGLIQVMEIHAIGRIGVAAMAAGIGRGSLKKSIAYARGRSSFGRPVAEFQVIQWIHDDTMRGLKNIGISPREKEVLDWLKQGKSSWDISVILGISERTVYFHVSNLMKKLGASNRPQAVAIATRLGLVDID